MQLCISLVEASAPGGAPRQAPSQPSLGSRPPTSLAGEARGTRGRQRPTSSSTSIFCVGTNLLGRRGLDARENELFGGSSTSGQHLHCPRNRRSLPAALASLKRVPAPLASANSEHPPNGLSQALRSARAKATSGTQSISETAATNANEVDSAPKEGAGTQPAPNSTGASPEGSVPGAVHQRGGRGLYTKFVQHCMLRMSQRMPLSGYHIKDEWHLLKGQDGASGTPALCRSTAASAPKIRFVRSADISAGSNLQVLNLVAFPRPSYYLPYFCADLVTFPRGHLIVIDMNPLFQSEQYLDRHIRHPVMPTCNRFSQVLPWGGEFTAESLQFFSPALLWSRLPLDEDVANGTVFDAFCAYLEVWLDMVDSAEEETDPDKVAEISEAQHRYMSWRAEKDPGRPVLTRLFGSEKCEDYIHNFLFDGLYSLGDKGFLDYFPQYRLPDGSICRKRSMAGKSYTSRPWDEHGKLIL